VLVCVGVALFATGVLVGFFAPRLVPALRPALGDEGLLVQSEEFGTYHTPDEFDVFYPRPYGSPPELKILDPGAMAIYEVTEQRPNGFRLKVTAREVNALKPGRYQARGLPVK
jgi:hypothetical protein